MARACLPGFAWPLAIEDGHEVVTEHFSHFSGRGASVGSSAVIFVDSAFAVWGSQMGTVFFFVVGWGDVEECESVRCFVACGCPSFLLAFMEP